MILVEWPGECLIFPCQHEPAIFLPLYTLKFHVPSWCHHWAGQGWQSGWQDWRRTQYIKKQYVIWAYRAQLVPTSMGQKHPREQTPFLKLGTWAGNLEYHFTCHHHLQSITVLWPTSSLLTETERLPDLGPFNKQDEKCNLQYRQHLGSSVPGGTLLFIVQKVIPGTWGSLTWEGHLFSVGSHRSWLSL